MAFTFSLKENPRATYWSLAVLGIVFLIFPFIAQQFGNSFTHCNCDDSVRNFLDFFRWCYRSWFIIYDRSMLLTHIVYFNFH